MFGLPVLSYNSFKPTLQDQIEKFLAMPLDVIEEGPTFLAEPTLLEQDTRNFFDVPLTRQFSIW